MNQHSDPNQKLPIDAFKDQETDGTNIEGGGNEPNPDMLDPNILDPLDPENSNDPNGIAGPGKTNDPSGTIVHSSTG
jgi:hypothetical protein